ncbi:dephospho-CoA kinase [Bacilliculturomica massiliensis]|uniref:dephospho-CoA kinase n=1 Tax=Bacilliculturomica massiliensis TaxID=1917867 RepID=UPI001A92B871|nr:dephospho-CoA kinase [Bacilliculturomica massiliensis]
MMVIGLTGGIGSGKSTVSDYLARKGCAIVDADGIAREITEPDSPVLEKLSRTFGAEIINPDGSLDRKKLGRMAFADEEKKKKLDEITHGEILRRIEERVAAFQGDVIFLDVPLLFETGLERLTDQVWVVDAEDEERIRRVRQRDGLSEEEIRDRIRRQMPREEKCARADRILCNSGAPEELYLQIDRLLGEIE